MAGSSESSLNAAIEAMDRAYARLESAVNVATQSKNESAALREAVQLEISTSWQQHSAGLESQLAELNSENEFLKEDNLRLSNQLQNLQQEYLELQSAAGHAVHRLDGAVKQLDLILEH
ncbi:MAG: hypothetical protein ACKVOE_10955 [Rickettsiales bacterium]